MTNEEAIVILDHLGVKGSQDHTPYEIGEALTMAIEALKMQKPKRRYAIIYDGNNFIQCYGVYSDYYRAVGKIYCLMTDSEEVRMEDGYTAKSFTDFAELEMETSFLWERNYEKGDTKICELWYLLLVEEVEDEHTQ